MILEIAAIVFACLLLPALWGWLMYTIYARLGVHRWLPGPKPIAPDTEPTGWDYQI